MTDDELADALSSDFTCGIAAAEEKKTTEVLTFFFVSTMQSSVVVKYFCYHNALL